MKKIILQLLLLVVAATGARAQSVLLTQPNDGQVWNGSSKQLIKWSASNMNNVKIDYSIDSARTWIAITPSYPAAVGEYEWTVPETPSAECFIRITDLENTSISSTSTQPFTISPGYVQLIQLPTSYTGRTATCIKWESASTGIVKLSYAGDDGIWKFISTNMDAARKYINWEIPDNISSIRIKIESAANAAIEYTSTPIPVLTPAQANAGKYHGGSYDGHTYGTNASKTIRVLTPVANTIYKVGDNANISWSALHVNLVKIEFSADSGTTWTSIKTTQAAQGKLNWTVPAPSSSRCLIRIKDTEDSTLVYAISPVFKIENPYLELKVKTDKPVTAGAGFPIKWEHDGIQQLNIFYSGTGNAPWALIAQGVNANTGYYLWKVTDSLPAVYFKVVSADVNGFSSQSNVPLSIIYPVINSQKYRGGSYDGAAMGTNQPAFLKMFYPTAGARFQAGSTMTMKWEYSGISAIRIQYSPDSGATWQPVAENIPARDGRYTWQVPSLHTAKGRISISSMQDSTMRSYSDSVFVIESNTLHLISPTHPTNVYANAGTTIRWEQAGVDSVAIYYSADNGITWATVISKIKASAGTFNWLATGPENIPLRLLIKDIRPGGPADTSEAILTILPLPVTNAAKYKGGSYDGHAVRSNITVLQLKSPQGGEVMRSGSTFNITWNAYNLEDSISIELSTDSGRTWTTIVQVAVKQGSYNWKIEDHYLRKAGSIYGREMMDVANDKCQIRLSSFKEDETAVALNKQNFTIITEKEVPPTLNILRPVKEDTLVAGNNFNITWTSTAVTGNVNIEMSPDSGKTWIPVAAALQNSGSFNWSVPQRLSWTNYTGKGWIRIIGEGAKDTSELFNWKQSIVTSIPDVDELSGLKIYPNPASRFLYVRGSFTTPRSFVITLRDLTGRSLYEKKYTGVLRDWVEKIDVQHIHQGMVFVSILYSDGEQITLPVIITR